MMTATFPTCLTPPLPFVHISGNLSVVIVHKISQFLAPSLHRAEVIYGWSLMFLPLHYDGQKRAGKKSVDRRFYRRSPFAYKTETRAIEEANSCETARRKRHQIPMRPIRRPPSLARVEIINSIGKIVKCCSTH